MLSNKNPAIRPDLLRILIVEDEPDTAKALKSSLELAGYSVEVASSPSEAQSLLSSNEFAIVVSDQVFDGQQTTGDEFLLDNWELLGNTPKILMTGKGADRISRLSELREQRIPVLDKGSEFFGYQLGLFAREELEPNNPSPPPLREFIRTGPHKEKQIFLCHASSDKPAVRELYKRLRKDGFEPWLDEENLLAGQEWQREIPKAVRTSDFVVICLSERSVTKHGYVQKEIKFALDVADEKPEGTIFLIPVRLTECEIPDRLREWHYVDLFRKNGYDRLIRALASASAFYRES